MTAFLKNNRYYLLLIAIITALFIPLIVIGLDLGFVGVSLGFEEHFAHFGLKAGMRYTLLWDQRHLISGQFYALLYTLFPGQSAAWYGSSLLTQFVLALFIFLLADSLLKGQWRVLSFAAALIAIFHTRQTISHFSIPTSGHDKLGIMFTLTGLYCYLRYVRNERRNFLWRDFSIAFYVVGMLLHEVSVLFFLLNPLIAYIEEREKPGFRLDWRWLMQLIKDSFWYPILFLIYFYLLTMLLPPSASGHTISLSPTRYIQQLGLGIFGEFSPHQFLRQIIPAFQGTWLILTLVLTAGIGSLIYGLWNTYTVRRIAWDRRIMLVVIGIAMIILNIASIAPVEFSLADSANAPRDTIPSAIGLGLAIAAILSLLLEYVPVRRVIFAGVVSILVAIGITRLFQVQQIYIEQHNAIEDVTTSLRQVIPAVDKDHPPYFMIIADAEHNDAIHSHDLNFPFLFDLMYNVNGSAADGVYANAPADQAPPPDQIGAHYQGRDIIVEPNAIYSPHDHGVPIDRSRLIMIEYDSATKKAQVVDERSAESFAGTNVIVRGDAPLISNLSLIKP